MAAEMLYHWQAALAALGPDADHTEVAKFIAAQSATVLG